MKLVTVRQHWRWLPLTIQQRLVGCVIERRIFPEGGCYRPQINDGRVGEGDADSAMPLQFFPDGRTTEASFCVPLISMAQNRRSPAGNYSRNTRQPLDGRADGLRAPCYSSSDVETVLFPVRLLVGFRRRLKRWISEGEARITSERPRCANTVAR